MAPFRKRWNSPTVTSLWGCTMWCRWEQGLSWRWSYGASATFQRMKTLCPSNFTLIDRHSYEVVFASFIKKEIRYTALVDDFFNPHSLYWSTRTLLFKPITLGFNCKGRPMVYLYCLKMGLPNNIACLGCWSILKSSWTCRSYYTNGLVLSKSQEADF